MIDTKITIPFFYGFYGYEFPAADMAERFGNNSVIGPGFMVKSATNWIYGIEYDFMFGGDVKYGFSILEHLMNSDGDIINGDGVPGVVALFERGHMVSARFGRMFNVLSPNPNSGFFFTVGGGFMSHKIRIEVENESVPQLKGDYKLGYDRLAAGFHLNQFIGYMYFGKSKLANFYGGIEIVEGFNKDQREYNFDTMEYTSGSRFDMLIGIKVGWIIPLSKRTPKEFYYY